MLKLFWPSNNHTALELGGATLPENKVRNGRFYSHWRVFSIYGYLIEKLYGGINFCKNLCKKITRLTNVNESEKKINKISQQNFKQQGPIDSIFQQINALGELDPLKEKPYLSLLEQLVKQEFSESNQAQLNVFFDQFFSAPKELWVSVENMSPETQTSFCDLLFRFGSDAHLSKFLDCFFVFSQIEYQGQSPGLMFRNFLNAFVSHFVDETKWKRFVKVTEEKGLQRVFDCLSVIAWQTMAMGPFDSYKPCYSFDKVVWALRDRHPNAPLWEELKKLRDTTAFCCFIPIVIIRDILHEIKKQPFDDEAKAIVRKLLRASDKPDYIFDNLNLATLSVEQITNLAESSYTILHESEKPEQINLVHPFNGRALAMMKSMIKTKKTESSIVCLKFFLTKYAKQADEEVIKYKQNREKLYQRAINALITLCEDSEVDVLLTACQSLEELHKSIYLKFLE